MHPVSTSSLLTIDLDSTNDVNYAYVCYRCSDGNALDFSDSPLFAFTVAEPSALAILTLALAGLGLVSRRR